MSRIYGLIAQVARLRFLRDDASEAGHSEDAQRYQTEMDDLLRLLHRAAQAGPELPPVRVETHKLTTIQGDQDA